MKPQISKVFRNMNGFWRSPSDGFLLSDFLDILGIIIDDDCQFCRIVQFDRIIEYRAYNNAKIVINVNKNDLKK